MAQRYRNSRDPNEGLEEIENNNNDNTEGGDPVSTPQGEDEGNWKKRHGDLRRATDRQLKDMQKELDELKGKLTQAERGSIQYPANEEDFQAWVTRYPVISKMVDTLVQKRIIEGNGMLEPKFNRVAELEKQIAQRDLEKAKEVALNKIIKAHPDFMKLVEDDKFQEWIGEQSEWVQNALWENETDARSAIDAVDLYKARNGAPQKRKQQEVENASNPRGHSGGASPTGGNEPLFKESQVQKMSDKDYERFETQIREAIRDGRFEYDLSA